MVVGVYGDLWALVKDWERDTEQWFKWIAGE